MRHCKLKLSMRKELPISQKTKSNAKMLSYAWHGLTNDNSPSEPLNKNQFIGTKKEKEKDD